MRNCIFCGMPMEDDDIFCTRCGKENPRQEAAQTEAGEPDAVLQDPEAAVAGLYDHLQEEEEQTYAETSAAAEAFADIREPSSSSAWHEEDDEEEPYALFVNRRVQIAAVAAAAAVLLVMVVLFARPSRKGAAQKAEKPSAEEAVAVYEEDGAAPGENLNRGEAQPEAGVDESAESQQDDAGSAQAPDQVSVQADHNASGDAAEKSDRTGQDGSGDSEKADQADKKDKDQKDKDQDEKQDENKEVTGTEGTGREAPAPASADQVTAAMEGQAAAEPAPAQQAGQEAAPTETLDTMGQGDGEDALAGFRGPGSEDPYILAESSTRYYTRAELEQLDSDTLQMAINEIYARHGRKFQTESVRTYFEGKYWYKGTVEPAAFDANDSQYFNQYEGANRELMTQIRAEREAAGSQP